jgi:outer membrane cobalamin receptor
MNRLSLAVQIGLAAGIVAATGLAQAQQAPAAPQDQAASKSQPKTLQTVVVTGSLIRRVDVETASPVTTVDRQNITSSGKPTLGDVLQQLPSIAGDICIYTNHNVTIEEL